MDIKKTLISLLRYAVCGGKFDSDIREQITAEDFAGIYKLSKKHDMAHIVAKAATELRIAPSKEIADNFLKENVLAFYRCQKIETQLAAICDVFEKSGIDFLPLKGSVIRQYYPEPWQRTSCDIDILVEKERIDFAIECLQTQLNYTLKEVSPHDVSLYSPSGVHLELHHRLVENTASKMYEEVLSKVWDYCEPVSGFSYKKQMSKAMFYYFHIAHMAKHFTSGGCGVKPLLDLWILEHKAGYALEDARELLEKGGLLKFAQSARKLSEVWFSQEEYDLTSAQMEQYIFDGGVYGNSQNRISVSRAKGRSKFRYALSKFFLPYRTIKMYYTVLEKHPWLMPFCQVHRWVRLIFCGGIKKSVADLKINNNVSQNQIDDARNLFSNIGL